MSNPSNRMSSRLSLTKRDRRVTRTKIEEDLEDFNAEDGDNFALEDFDPATANFEKESEQRFMQSVLENPSDKLEEFKAAYDTPPRQDMSITVDPKKEEPKSDLGNFNGKNRMTIQPA